MSAVSEPTRAARRASRAQRWAAGWRRTSQAPTGFRRIRESGLHRRVPWIGWLYYLVSAHGTSRLFALGVIGVSPALLLLLIGIENEVFLSGFATLALLLSGWVAGWIWRPRLTVRCLAPPRVEAGSLTRLRYEAANESRWTARDVTLDTLTYPDPRHLRLRPARLDALPPGARETVEGAVQARYRGSYVLPALRVDSSFPFGIWRWGRTQREPRSLIVYPRYTRLQHFDIPLGVRNRLDAADSRQKAREAIEFHGCREFRAGDALRHVHPRSSARLGMPVVKEFQAEGRARTAIVVDTLRTPLTTRVRLRGADPLEGVLSLAAAAVDALCRTDRVLELLVAGPGVYRFVSAGRVGYLDDVLDILASVEADGNDPLARLEPLLFEEIRAIQSVLLLLLHWNPRRAALVEALRAWEVGLKVVLVTPGTRVPSDVPGDVICLPFDQVQRGEVHAL